MSFIEDTTSQVDACLESYVVISTPSPATKNRNLSRTRVIGSPSPRLLRARRLRAYSALVDRDALVHSIDLGKISQRFSDDNLLGLR